MSDQLHQVFFVKIEVSRFLKFNLVFNFFVKCLKFVKWDGWSGMMLSMVIHVPYKITYQEIRFRGPAVFCHVSCLITESMFCKQK